MKINETTSLVLKNIYVYDIQACHYNLLIKFGYDVSNLNKDNKTERNTQIGKMMREDSNLSKKFITFFIKPPPSCPQIIDAGTASGSCAEEDRR